ncbi:hypothetical protein BDB01DRAFT_786390 [Pilobolus umbonatus]|nr:hypothetical protein BDB01DRAFT_786390 [Pilobolus umbonatus]
MLFDTDHHKIHNTLLIDGIDPIDTHVDSIIDSYASVQPPPDPHFKLIRTYSYRKPFHNPIPHKSKSTHDSPEKKIELLELQLSKHIKRESDLEREIASLKQQKLRSQKQFSNKKKYLLPSQNNSSIDGSIWKDLMIWTGTELPSLFGYEHTENKYMHQDITSEDITSVYIERLRNKLQFYVDSADNIQDIESYRSLIFQLHEDVVFSLNSWNEFNNHQHLKEETSVQRLLKALDQSLIRNRQMENDTSIIIQQYESQIKSVIQMMSNKQDTDRIHLASDTIHHHHACQKILAKTQTVLEAEITRLKTTLAQYQDEKDEYETTLEMVRSEMKMMMEELEESRQQALRYKTQANRLRAGLETIQRREREECVHNDDMINENTAVHLMYDVIESQLIGLEQESQEQAFVLAEINKSANAAEKRYHQSILEKNKEIREFQCAQQMMKSQLELLLLEKKELLDYIEQASEENADRNKLLATISSLESTLKATRVSHDLQTTRIRQLEQQHCVSLGELESSLKELEDIFRKRLDRAEISKEIAVQIEHEQASWRNRQKMEYEKKHAIDQLNINRENRFLSCQLVEIEDEVNALKRGHQEALVLLQHNIQSSHDRIVQDMIIQNQMNKRTLTAQCDTLYQQNQALMDEAFILHSRNRLMAETLSKLMP